MSAKDLKIDLVADIKNKIQLAKTVLEYMDQERKVSKEQLALSLKKLNEAERLLEGFL